MKMRGGMMGRKGEGRGWVGEWMINGEEGWGGDHGREGDGHKLVALARQNC